MPPSTPAAAATSASANPAPPPARVPPSVLDLAGRPGSDPALPYLDTGWKGLLVSPFDRAQALLHLRGPPRLGRPAAPHPDPGALGAGVRGVRGGRRGHAAGPGRLLHPPVDEGAASRRLARTAAHAGQPARQRPPRRRPDPRRSRQSGQLGQR